MDIPFSEKQIHNSALVRPTGKEPVPLGSGVITRLLGDGGMASVYEIWNSQLEVNRAVKLLHPNCNKESLERFQTEIKITAKLHHPYIIEIHGVGEWNDLPYIEMEKADGITLEELIQTRGAMPAEVCAAIGLMTSKALEYAHNHEYILYNKRYHGIIHRDLKPGNIMVCKDGTVKLMDFGIARPTDTSFHTIDGAVIGTLQYLSPEQLSGKELDVKTDIYSLGICLYEMACGYLAFPENNITRLLSDKSKNRYKPLNSYDIKLPPRFIEVVQQCMTYDKNKRLPTAALLSSELEKIYSKHTNNKPEITVAAYLETSCKGKNLPRDISKKTIHGKILPGLVFISILVVYIAITTYRNNKPQHQITQHDSTTAVSHSSLSQQATVPSNPQHTDSFYMNRSIMQNNSLQTSLHNTKTNPHLLNKSYVPETKKRNVANDSVFLSALKVKYDTDDILFIAQKEIQEGNYSNGLAILNKFDSKSIKAQVLKARVLEHLNYSNFTIFVTTLNTNEAELLLDKAKVLIDKGNISDVDRQLDRASTAPREIISSEIVMNKILFYKALITSRQFDNNPDENTWKAALGAWYIVKKELRSEPSHEYYKRADTEIDRISAKYRKIKDGL